MEIYEKLLMFNVAIKYKSRLYLISQLSQVWWNPCSYSAAVSWFEGFRLPTLQENRTVQTLSGKNLPSISAFAKFYGNQLRVLCTISMKCFTSLLYYWKSQGQTLTKSTFGHALLSIYRTAFECIGLHPNEHCNNFSMFFRLQSY